jgi:hypothetical protein
MDVIMTTTYTSVVGLKDSKPFLTFKEALADFYKRINGMADNHGICPQILETACWINRKTQGSPDIPMGFYDVRDFSHELGLVVEKSYC